MLRSLALSLDPYHVIITVVNHKLWATNALTKTPIFHDYYFYHLTNAADFLTGGGNGNVMPSH
jgi:hypothetical protein